MKTINPRNVTLESVAEVANESTAVALAPDCNRPIERLFLVIKTGDTPETNQVSRLAVEWLDEWTASIFSVLEVKK
jgi:hypothetical protein